MAISYADQMTMTNYIIDRLERGLAGRDETECLNVFPQDRFHLGILAPRTQSTDPLVQPSDIEPRETGSNEIQIAVARIKNSQISSEIEVSDGEVTSEVSPSAAETEDGEKFSREDLLNRRGAPSALGIEFIVEKLDSPISLTVEASFAIYTRRFPTWEQQQYRIQHDNDDQDAQGHSQQTVQLSDRHARRDIRVGPIPVTIDMARNIKISAPFDDQISAALTIEKQQVDVWRKITRMSLPRSVFSSRETYLHYLESLTSEINLPPISVYLDIRTVKMPNGRTRIGVYIVNGTPTDPTSVSANASRFLIDVQMSCKVESGEIVPIEIVTAAHDYQYDPRVWAIGQGCSVKVDFKNRTFLTEGLAKYDQQRLITKDYPEVRFSALKENPLEILGIVHKSMHDYANQWNDRIESGDIDLPSERMLSACRNDLESFRNEVERFYQGIEALQSDPRLLQAFKAMHNVMERSSLSRGISKWRLFQLCFIVTQLPALAVRENKIDTDILDYADVLWFPTGGGKTEAYLGLISCALLYDRLRGKVAGVTAWLRFPLRMLSVQQLQRAVRIVYETEQERKSILGADSNQSDVIALGYFVGGTSTPNQLSDASWSGKWKLSELEKNQNTRNQLRLVRVCPKCNRQSIEIEVDKKSQRIRHVCANCHLDLNIFVSDDEIYRYLPAVVIGTVDKLPSIAWRDKFAHLWGGVNSKCPDHGYASGKYCIVYGCNSNRTAVQLYDPNPSLQIQDELHLLREELGTFAGHYESLSTTCQTRVGLPPKIIAATATVEGLDRQSRHLYNLKARRFPSRGYALGESFYTEYGKDDQSNPQISRRYLAFKSPFSRPPEASARVLEIEHKAIRDLYTLLENEGPIAVAQELGISNIKTQAQILELLDKYDTTLTYVGSKAHGSYIERQLRDNIGRHISKAGERQIEVSYLNGESTIDDIADTIDNLESGSDWDSGDRLDAVIGTSLISHGVDEERFNFMVLSGMPGRTAEYIQASSRSGRRFVGIVVVALSPWLLREQSYYHRFTSYHYHMEHLVEPVPINRFSRFAVDKTMPGMLAGILNAYLAPKHQTSFTKARDVQNALYTDRLFSEEEILDLVLKALGTATNIHSNSLQQALIERANKKYKVEIRSIRSNASNDKIPDVMSTKPMTSLRDIDDPVPFEPKEYSFATLRWISR